LLMWTVSGRYAEAGSTTASHVVNRKRAPSTRYTGTSVAPADCASALTPAWTRKVRSNFLMIYH